MQTNQERADSVSEAASTVKSSFDDGIISPATGLTGAINTMFAANDLYWEYMEERLQNRSIKDKIFKGDCFKAYKPKKSMKESFSHFRSTSLCMISHDRCNIRRLRVALPNTKDDDEAFECLKNLILNNMYINIYTSQ